MKRLGTGAPARSGSRSAFVGSVGKGWRGMVASARICCRATPDLVKQSSLKAWCHCDQLSEWRSSVGWVGVAVAAGEEGSITLNQLSRFGSNPEKENGKKQNWFKVYRLKDFDCEMETMR